MAGGVGNRHKKCHAAAFIIMKDIIQNVVKRAAQLVLLVVCMTCLTSCGMITGLVGFLVSIPFRVVDAICP